MKILDNFASLLFCFHTFGVSRRALDPNPDLVRILPDPGWFSGSRASMERLTQKIKNTKRGLANYLENLFNGILISFTGQDLEPRIRIRIRKPDPHP